MATPQQQQVGARPPSMAGGSSTRSEFNIVSNPVMDVNMSGSQFSGVLIPHHLDGGASVAETLSPAPSYILIPTNMAAAGAAAAEGGGGGGGARNRMSLIQVLHSERFWPGFDLDPNSPSLLAFFLS